MRKECCVLLVTWIDHRHKLMPWGKHGKPLTLNTDAWRLRHEHICTRSGPPAHARFPCLIPSKYRQKIRVTVIILLQSNEAAVLFPELILLITEYACMSMYLCVCLCEQESVSTCAKHWLTVTRLLFTLYVAVRCIHANRMAAEPKVQTIQHRISSRLAITIVSFVFLNQCVRMGPYIWSKHDQQRLQRPCCP